MIPIIWGANGCTHLCSVFGVHRLHVRLALRLHRAAQRRRRLGAQLLRQPQEALAGVYEGLKLIEPEAGVAGGSGAQQLHPAALRHVCVLGPTAFVSVVWWWLCE